MTPHLVVRGRPARLCVACADAAELERRRLCEECAARPSAVAREGRGYCSRCALRLERDRASFRAASHARLTRRVEVCQPGPPTSTVAQTVPAWPDERW